MRRILPLLLVLMLLTPIGLTIDGSSPVVDIERAHADWHWPEWVVDLVQDFCDAFPDLCDGCEYC